MTAITHADHVRAQASRLPLLRTCLISGQEANK
jgi:hypothetical protein